MDNAQRAKLVQSIVADTHSFAILSLGHSGGLNMQVLPTFLGRGEISFFPVGHFRSLFEQVLAKKFTHGVLTPYPLRTMMEMPTWKDASFDGKLTILTGSSPVSESYFHRATKASMHLLGVYGMTEIGPMVSMIKENEVSFSRPNKFPLGHPLKGFSLETDKVQKQMLIKGPCTGSYITSNENKNNWKIAPCGNPLVYSGDRGLWEGDNLYYCGRIKREINFAGFKINPEEIEEVLLNHRSIKQALVYSEKCLIKGEIPCVKIVPQEEKFDWREVKKISLSTSWGLQNSQEVGIGKRVGEN